MKSRSRLLDEREVAEILNVSRSWLQKRRVNKLPPAAVKIGACVRYEPAVIDAFIAANAQPPRGGSGE